MGVIRPDVARLRKKKKTHRLIRALGSRSWSVRSAAAEALGEVGDIGAVEPLIAALDNCGRDKGLCERVSLALGMIGDPRAVEPLIILMEDDRKSMRLNASLALGMIGDPRALKPLLHTLRDDDWDVRRAAAEALGKIGWDPDYTEAGAFYWISWLVLFDHDNDCYYVNDKAVDALVGMGECAVEPLIELLRGDDKLLRCVAAESLGTIGDSRAVEPIVSALEEEDNWLRMKAAEALGSIGTAEGVEPLTSVLESCARSKGVCRAAINALGRIGDVRAAEPLASVSSDDELRADAEKALENLNARDA
ncbi:MAG: HEAT repeat domain-containing protein [Actinomycetota bacterium]|nr:HEAT repeat domain-containing protein [Actinomycetota bacterium]